MNATDELLASAAAYAARFDKGELPRAPAKKVAVLTCMDGRINPYSLLGLTEGDANVLRNAGGVVTDDQIRSLAISQHLLGTEEVVVIQHTDCGLREITDEEFKAKLERASGHRPEWAVEAFADLDQSVREQIRRIQRTPFLPRSDQVRGFVYDVATGRLREVR
jgi:carbonic anhydrase